MCRSSCRAIVVAWLLVGVLSSACAAPPNKEIADAQAALKAAQAAGAQQYAPTAYASAAEAYRLANQAVTEGDYRLALSHALESRERSRVAEREAAAAREQLRLDAQQKTASVTTLVARARTRLDQAEAARVPARTIREFRATLARLEQDVQEAGEVFAAEDYATAQRVLAGVEEYVGELIAAIEKAAAAQPQKRRR